MLGPVSGDLDIRYARNGDVHLAYRVLGDGPIDLVFVQGILTHLRVSWEYAGFRRFCEQLASFSRVILFDKRGMGMSDRVAVGTLEDRMDDVRAVMDAAGSERAALLGVSEGAPMSILFAATYPERTHALLLCGAEVREETDADWPWGESTREEFEVSMDTLSEQWGRPEWAERALEAFIPSAADDPGFRQWWTRALTDAASPGAARAFMRMAFDIDVRHVLPSVHVPALVVHRSGDRVCHIENGRYIARNIAGARYVELDGEDHIPFGPGGGEIVAEVREFLTGVRGPVEFDRVLATVVFTDIVGSTARAVDLGDRRWRDLLDQHHARVRAQLDRFGGHEIDTAGDGFLASFDGPARAIRCAAAAVAAVAELGIEIRAGVHTGECELADGKLRGIAVHIGARVAAEAAPGEVLVSSTVRDLVAGSGLRFAERGTFGLKGVPGEWRLYALEP
jgi:class 3 adenylate cyclase/pimeloyl-ACP methyl ester carboxylesterase